MSRLANSDHIQAVNLFRTIRLQSNATTAPDARVFFPQYTIPDTLGFLSADEIETHQDGSPMLARLRQLSQMDLDAPISEAALDAAKNLICEIVKFLICNKTLPIPSLFATSHGQISFEWQPQRIKSALIATILLAQDGGTADFLIGRLAEQNPELLMDSEGASLSTVRAFLVMLTNSMDGHSN